MFLEEEFKYVVTIFIRAQIAESGPPLGTVLGNLGVNSAKFCKDFNDFTKDLPSYFVLKVRIFIAENKSYKFIVWSPSACFIISLLKYERIVRVSGREVKEYCISLKSIIKLAKFKFPYYKLENSFKIICGSVIASNLLII